MLAKTDETAKAGKAFTAFIVDAKTKGVKLGRKEINMGQRASDVRGISFDNVVVSDSNCIGQPGDGFKIAMTTFDYTRPAVAAVAIGLAQRAMDESIKYSLERKTMGMVIL